MPSFWLSCLVPLGPDNERLITPNIYNLKPLISSMTDEFSFTPVASTLFMSRENHENRENFRALITTIPFNDLASLI